MGILITFVPWLIFWVLLSQHKLFLAIVIALAASMVTILMERMAGRSVKILQAGTFAVFVIFGLAALVVDRAWLGHWIRLMSNASLTLIVLISILVRRPFTLQYARESVPKEFWNSPEFLRANYIITWVWLAAFVVNTALSALNYIIPSINVVVNYVMAICPFFAASIFTSWYTKKGKKRDAG